MNQTAAAETPLSPQEWEALQAATKAADEAASEAASLRQRRDSAEAAVQFQKAAHQEASAALDLLSARAPDRVLRPILASTLALVGGKLFF